MKKDKTKKEFIEEIAFLKKRVAKLEKLGSQRKRVEDAFDVSYECLISVLDSLDSLVYVADFNSYELLFINKYGRDIWGDTQGQKCWQVIQKGQKGPCSFCTNDKLVSDTGISTGVCQWEFQNTVNGRWYECRDQAIPWTGKVLVRMEIATDITESKQAVKALQESENRIRDIAVTVPGVMFQFFARKDGSMGMYYISDQAKKIIGVNIDQELFVERFIAMVVPEQRESFVQSIQKAVNEVFEWKFEWLMMKPTGELIWLFAHSIPVVKGDEIIFSGIFQDITERKKAEETLIKSQKNYSAIFDQSPIAIELYDSKGCLVNVNSACIDLFGVVNRNEISGFKLFEDPNISSDIKTRLLAKEAVRFEAEFKFEEVKKLNLYQTTCSGIKILDWSITPLTKGTLVIGYVEQIYDITERKRSEDALRVSEEKFRFLVENSHDIIYRLTPDGTFTFVSPAWTALLGHPVNQVEGHPFQPFVHPDDLVGCMAWLQKVIETGQRQEGVEYRVRHIDGSWRWHTSSAVPLRNEVGTIIGFEGTARDITDRKKVEEALQESKNLLLEMTTQVPGVVYQFYARPNGEMGFYYISDRSEQTIGLKSDLEGYLERFVALVIPEHRESFIQSIQKSVKESSEWKYEGILQKPTGEKIWFFGNSTPAPGENEIVFNGLITNITKQKRIEEDLEVFKRFSEESASGVGWADVNGKVIYINPTLCRMFGEGRPEDAYGNPVFQYYDEKTQQRLAEKIFPSVRSMGQWSGELDILRKNGEIVPTSNNIFLLLDKNGNLLYFANVLADITERKQAEEALLAAKDYTENIIKSMLDTLIVINPDGKIRSINEATAVLLGYKEAELIGKPFGTIVAEEEEEEEGIPFIGTRLRELIKEGFIKEYGMTYKTKLGEMIPVSLSGAVMRDKDAELIGIVCIGRDLRERKKAEKIILESEEKIHLLLDSTAEAIYGLDMHGNCTFCNNACLSLLGYKHHDELLGKNMHWQIHGKYSDETIFPVEECRIFKAFQQGEGTHVDDEVLWRSDGTSFPAEYWSYPQRRDGVVVGAVVTFLNITERKCSEDALRESEETLRVNIENSFDVIFTLNKEGEFLFVSSAWERHFGYPIGDVMGKSFAPFVHPDDIAPLSEYLERVLSSGKSQASPSYRVKHADGSWRWIVCNGTPYVDTKGERQFIGVGRDITESKKADEMLKEAQEQLFQTSKMASLGQLSAGAAHEINNPLAGVVGFTEAILLDLENERIAPDRIANDLKIVLKNANRCKVIISNLLNFIRAKDLKRQESDLNSFIDDALALVEYKTNSQNIEVVKKYEKSPRKVSIDQDQMMQVLINVISNAQNAMPEGGELLVRTWSENNFALIEVKDTGIGIEKENLLRVFDPFFTTREPGQGVGLGLSISYSIMKRHEGSIEVKSDGKNKGASFIIKIPA